MTILGLHHITLVCADAQRTVSFYTGILGLRLIKKTVNFDDPTSYHVYFGDEGGSPGSAITFFEWPHLSPGYPGIGGTHHVALSVADDDGLLKWKRRLTDLGLKVDGPRDEGYCHSIAFRDPDGVILEIATLGPGWNGATAPGGAPANQDATWPEPVPTITPEMALSYGMHHLTAISSDLQRTHAFFGDLLGMRRIQMAAATGNGKSSHWVWGVGDGRPGTFITYLERNPAQERRAYVGTGQTHHFALAVPDAAPQLEWREKLVRAGLRVSPVMERVYFKSIYTNDPDGHIVELATFGPGFAADEDVRELGNRLALPPWLERYRGEIESALKPVSVP